MDYGKEWRAGTGPQNAPGITLSTVASNSLKELKRQTALQIGQDTPTPSEASCQGTVGHGNWPGTPVSQP